MFLAWYSLTATLVCGTTESSWLVSLPESKTCVSVDTNLERRSSRLECAEVDGAVAQRASWQGNGVKLAADGGAASRLWVKNRYLKWNPRKWKHRPRPAVARWFNFDPHPAHDACYTTLSLSGQG